MFISVEIGIVVIPVKQVFHFFARQGQGNARVASHEIPTDGGDLHGPYGKKAHGKDDDGDQDLDKGPSLLPSILFIKASIYSWL
jgi:hypothetical protein